MVKNLNIKLLATMVLFCVSMIGMAQNKVPYEKYFTKYTVVDKDHRLLPDSIQFENINYSKDNRVLPIRYHVKIGKKGVVRWCMNIADTNKSSLQRRKYSDSMFRVVHKRVGKPIDGEYYEGETLEFTTEIENGSIFYKLSKKKEIIGELPLNEYDTVNTEFQLLDVIHPNFFKDVYYGELKYNYIKIGETVIENDNHLESCFIYKVFRTAVAKTGFVDPSEIILYISTEDFIPRRIIFYPKNTSNKSYKNDDEIVLFKLLSN